MSHDSAVKQGTAFCLAQRFAIDEIAGSISDSTLVRNIKGALLIEGDGSWSIVFGYGAVVHWNVGDDHRNKLHRILLDHAENPLTAAEEDNFTFALNCPGTRIVEDHIELESFDPMLIFSLSHGMAQSIKLASFESSVLTTINSTSYIPKSLAEEGTTKLSRRNIARIRGQLFLTKSEVILNCDLLDTPDFFWEYPEYGAFYSLTAKYLEIVPRTEVLYKKLETIHELFEMLADEQKHRHSSILEWIIIWLIVFEIVMAIYDKLF
jgi:uncharacterized Rmd1/YagE family protein